MTLMMPDQEPESTPAPPLTEATLPARPKVESLDDANKANDGEKLAPEVTLPSKNALKPVTEPIAEPPAPPITEVVITPTPKPEPAVKSAENAPPWTLQQFFNGEIDLDVELIKRFPNMPVMSNISFRSLGTRTGRGVATLTTSDGAASVTFDADTSTRTVQMSFTYGSMLTLRFALEDLSDMDRARWLELMRREQGGLAFLWGPSRWARDYVVCISRKYFTNFYAFSPHSFESAIRLTPDVTKKLLDWLEQFWKAPPPDQEPPKLLTW
jgi:hypothetical protein